MPTGLSAQLLPARTRVAPGDQLSYDVLNTGNIAIAFGRPHRLEQLKDGEWTALRAEPGFRVPLYTAQPAHARQLKMKIPRRMQSGRYRLTLRIRDYARRVDPRVLRGPRPVEPAPTQEFSFEFEVSEAQAETA